MAAVKKVPMRQCVGCGEKKGKKELLRVVKQEQEPVVFDLSGKKNGRGAYICKNAACLELAVKKHALERALKTQISQEECDNLKKELEAIEE